jgi:acetylornithine/succinyldiaminopimelate/putrescine aminotransferase/predicted amino acid dehydrogenase
MNSKLNLERAQFLSILNFDASIESAKGAYLYNQQGEALLDFTSQYGAVPFGHNPDFLWQELLKQSALSPGIMIQPLQSSAAAELSVKLTEIAPGQLEHVILACTGAEAVEAAIKMAKSRTSRRKILSTINSFHGKTMGALLSTGNEYYREPFFDSNDDFSFVDFNDLSSLEEALKSEEYAAFIIEPIQGEGGMVVPNPGYLKGCEDICQQFGTLFIVDEIQTGLGRTGELFACQHENINPDILLLAKALGGGMMPISACLANNRAWSKELGQRHSSTFANNSLSATIALAVIDKLIDDDSVLKNVRKMGAYLQDKLNQLVSAYPRAYESVSGYGLMQGLTLSPWLDQDSYMSGAIFEQGYAVPFISSYLLQKHQVFTAPTLNSRKVLRIQPNYLINEKQVDKLMVGLHDIGELISGGLFSELFRNVIGMESKRPVLMPIANAKKQISDELPRAPKATDKKLGTFAFLMHFTNEKDLLKVMPGGMESYTSQEQDQITKWGALVKEVDNQPTPSFYIPMFSSKLGGFVDGWLISTFLTPREMMRLSKAKKKELLDAYMQVAKAKGATMVGLGAYTSIISRSGTLVADHDVPVTTGNAYTALVSTDSIRQVCIDTQRPLAKQHLGIVGVLGSVGRLALLDLATECQTISLIGNSKNQNNVSKLEVLAGEFLVELLSPTSCTQNSVMRDDLVENGVNISIDIQGLDALVSDDFREVYTQVKMQYEQHNPRDKSFPIILSNDLKSELLQCDIVITATSNGEAFIQPDMLREGAIVCDVARPSDLTSEVMDQRQDVMAFAGGLVTMPEHLRFGRPNIVGLPDGVSLACLSETIILSMSQVARNYSLGGISSLQEARQVFQWGVEHGFGTYIPDTVRRLNKHAFSN